MGERIELSPFPFKGISVAHLSDLQEEISNAFVKVSVRCFGKEEIAPRPLARLLERISGILTGGFRLQVVLATTQADTDSVLVTLILATKTPQALSEIQNSSRIRETLKTQVQRQAASRKLGEEAELVPFAGFTSVEISTELDLTTHEVCEVFVKPRTLQQRKSYVDTVDDSRNAGTLVMHCWQDAFKSIYESLHEQLKATQDEEETTFVWLDLFSINQHVQYQYSPNWLTSTFCDALGQIGSALLVLPNWREPTVLRRAWIMWELLACVQQGIELAVIMPAEQRASFETALFLDLPQLINQCFNQVDAHMAQSNDKHAQTQILNCIRDSVGYDGASIVVKDRILEWVSLVSEQTSRDPEKTKDVLATSQFCYSLAKILSVAQGKHSEAEEMLRKTVDIRTIQLGPEHALTIEAQIALVNVFRFQSKLAEAELMIRKVCENSSKSKGAEHDDTLLALATLSRILVDRGMFEEAEEMCQDCLEVLLRKYGVKDKRTIETLKILSQLADLRADSELAASRLRQALEGYEELFGADAPQTLNCETDLANLLAELEQFDEAERIFRNSAAKLAEQKGNAHEWTVKAVTGLAVLLKLRESLPPDYIPGEFSKATQTVFDAEQVNPGLNSAITSIRSTRHTRHEKIKQQGTAGEAGRKPAEARPPASRTQRGWLEKLPMELSQREKERQLKRGTSAALQQKQQPHAEDEQSQTAKPKSILLKMMSNMGSTKFIDKAASVVVRSKSLTAMPAGTNAVQDKWEKRFFKVQSNQKSSSLVYWLSEDDSRNGRDIRDHFELDDYTSRVFETSPFGDLCFSVTGPKGRLHLRALTAEDKKTWIHVLKSALAFRGAGEKSSLFTNGEIAPAAPVAAGVAGQDFTGSFVNMDSILQSQHSVVLHGTNHAVVSVNIPEGGVSALLKDDMAGVSFD